MLNVNLVAGNTTANTAVAITQAINTNNNLNISNNQIQVLNPGIYEIVGNATVTSSAADDYGLGVYANNELQGIESVNLATGASETTTIPIYAVVNIINTTVNGYATIAFMPVGAPVIVGGNISVKKVS